MSFISLSHANNENVLVFNNFLDDVQFFSSQFDALASKYKTTLRGKKEVGKDKFFLNWKTFRGDGLEENSSTTLHCTVVGGETIAVKINFKVVKVLKNINFLNFYLFL